MVYTKIGHSLPSPEEDNPKLFMAQGVFHRLPLNSHHFIYERQMREALPSMVAGARLPFLHLLPVCLWAS